MGPESRLGLHPVSHGGPLVGGISAAAGVAAALGPPAPTGHPVVDAVLVGASTAVAVALAARAPWWLVATVAGLATSIAVDASLIVIGLVALAIALAAGGSNRERPALLAASAALGLNVLARADLDGFLGLSAIVAIAAGSLLIVAGARRSSTTVRRSAWFIVGTLALIAIVTTVGFAIAAARSRSDLAAGLRWAEQAVSALENGDFATAAENFESASGDLARAHRELTTPWARGAAVVPIVAQHQSAAAAMSGAGSVGAATVAAALDEIDSESLRAVDGRFDLDAVAALAEPFRRAHGALDELSAAIRSARSVWLVNRAAIEIEDFEVSVAEHAPQLENAIAAIGLAPQLLGAERPQRYLVLFTTPSESRGFGGFIGNHAELTVDDGQLRLDEIGRAEQLDAAVTAAGARLAGPDEFLARYGRFGFDTDGAGLVGDAAFRNLTMTPNFPWVGEVARDLYAQATGRTVDGVIVIDPFVVASLLRYTGPIDLSTMEQRLDSGNAAAFLLREQYVLAGDKAERVDALEEAAELTFDALLAGSLPEPITLARDLGPLARERRLAIWSPDAAEQDLFRRVHVAGEIPVIDGADGWSVTLSNGGANKIDSFLQRRASYESRTDPSTGATEATLRVELTNTAPAAGLPPYVIGNRVGLPSGTSRLYVSLYSPFALVGATLDGRAIGLEADDESGWHVYSRFVDVAPGATATIELSLAGRVSRPDEVVTWVQPMANPLEVSG